MGLFFGNGIRIASTILICIAWIYIIYSAVNQSKTQKWGRKTAFLALFGLLICCFAATRDGYDKSVQASFDSTVQAGLFTISSIQSTLACIGGAIIAFSSISSIFVKNHKYRKVMFFLLSGAIVFKTLLIEISRVVC